MSRESGSWSALVQTPDGSAFESAHITEWLVEATEIRPYVNPQVAAKIGKLLTEAGLEPTPEVQVVTQLKREGRVASALVPALGRLMDQMFMLRPEQVDASYVRDIEGSDFPGAVDRLVNALEQDLDVTDLQFMDADGVHLTFDNATETFVPYVEGGYHPELPIERGGKIVGMHNLGDQMGLQSVVRRDTRGPHADAFLMHYPVGYLDTQGVFQQTATVLSPHYLDCLWLRSLGIRFELIEA